MWEKKYLNNLSEIELLFSLTKADIFGVFLKALKFSL